MTDVAHPHHGIDYIEFTVTDMTAAQEFYGSVFGWKFTQYGPDYAGIQGPEPGREVGGFSRQAEGSTGGPLIVLYSQDLEATLAAVRGAGASIVTEPFEFPGGRRFHFQDPSGNELAVWSES
ncbi:MAG: VOC family protein [Acidobacteriota bacterium]